MQVDKDVVVLGKSHLLGMRMGDSFQSEGFFQGLVPDSCVWTLTDGTLSAGEYIFEVTYLRVKVAMYRAVISKSGQVSLEEL